MPPGVEATTGHTKLPAEPGNRKAIRQLADEARPRGQLLFDKVRCRQLEKILLPPELTVLLAQPGQFSPLLAGELTLLGRAKVTSVNPGLSHPLGQAAVGQSQPLGHRRAAKAFCEAERCGLFLLLIREPASGFGRAGPRWTV